MTFVLLIKHNKIFKINNFLIIMNSMKVTLLKFKEINFWLIIFDLKKKLIFLKQIIY